VGFAEEEYRIVLFGREHLRFRYESIRLARLDAEEYSGKGNPLGVALAALMDRRKAGDPLRLRALMMQRVARSEKDDDGKFLLLNLIETYFKLTAEQKESFSRLLSKKEFREAQEMEVTWADEIREEGREKGLEQGREEGLVAGKRETLLHLLATKFGTLPGETALRVQAMESPDELDRYLDRLLTAKSLDEMGL
jgi:predicted transposase YdaD